MARVFLSHAGPDKPTVRRIAAALRASGHNTWLDEEDILVGESIPAAVERGLREADFVVLCLSRAAAERGWIEAERDAALMDQLRERRERILPVRLEGVAPPFLVASLRYVDLFPNEQSFDNGIARLKNSIEAYQARHAATACSSEPVNISSPLPARPTRLGPAYPKTEGETVTPIVHPEINAETRSAVGTAPENQSGFLVIGRGGVALVTLLTLAFALDWFGMRTRLLGNGGSRSEPPCTADDEAFTSKKPPESTNWCQDINNDVATEPTTCRQTLAGGTIEGTCRGGIPQGEWLARNLDGSIRWRGKIRDGVNVETWEFNYVDPKTGRPGHALFDCATGCGDDQFKSAFYDGGDGRTMLIEHIGKMTRVNVSCRGVSLITFKDEKGEGFKEIKTPSGSIKGQVVDGKIKSWAVTYANGNRRNIDRDSASTEILEQVNSVARAFEVYTECRSGEPPPKLDTLLPP